MIAIVLLSTPCCCFSHLPILCCAFHVEGHNVLWMRGGWGHGGVGVGWVGM